MNNFVKTVTVSALLITTILVNAAGDCVKTIDIVSKGNETELQAYKRTVQEEPCVVVKFSATWCPPCKAIAPVFAKLSSKSENKEIVFVAIDVDKSAAVAESYRVKSMPTFIFYKDGKEVTRFSGNQPSKLKSEVANLRN